MDGQTAGIIIVGAMVLISFLNTLFHGRMLYRNIQYLNKQGEDNLEARLRHLEMMKTLSNTLESHGADIHKIFRGLGVAAETITEHNERIYALEKKVDKLVAEVKLMFNEQENMKITHL